MKFSSRQAGLLKLLGGAAIYAVLFAFIFSRGGFGDSRGGTFYIITIGAPGALALLGLMELVTGHPFQRLADAWDAMPGWKQAVLGLATVLAAVVIVFGPLLLYAWVRDG
ncbi:MAG: hypothetical protein QNJ40_06500 [Xanthomonadales bacterium]|nr:hypothetical protein [Xanthomonadales bacterium]